jgi:hypothetical protein
MLGNFSQVCVRQVGDQIVHGRIRPSTVPKRNQLVVKVGRGLARDARKVAVAGTLAALPIAGDAPLNTSFQGIQDLEGG